ncbi:hypothetical protein HPB50_020048 [Hyalomma asiaticum]|uniref:Uncharacterized protein n=1 Tax=Hyalomma asiaticum TaxID=266040 RepID=A0ACB7RNR8_HYAAI|nr:hypothetical protein HPB50_020048 [Hyalomma asiaticum]
MPKRRRETDESSTSETARRRPPSRVHVRGVRSRNTGLSVDYKKPCTRSQSRTCHVSDNIAAWNAFFINIGLKLQENELGGLSLFAVPKNLKRSGRPTMEEKAQAATRLHWLLEKHSCVDEVSVNEDAFRGHESTLCDALSDSVSVTAVQLRLFSLKVLLTDDLISALSNVRNLERIGLVFPTKGEFIANLGSLVKSSPLDVFRAIHANTRLRPADVALVENLFGNEMLCSTSITARVPPSLRGRSRTDVGSSAFTWNRSQSLTTLSVIASRGWPEVDVQAICDAVLVSPVLTKLGMGLLKLKAEYAAPIGNMLGSTNILKHFGLTYIDVEDAYRVRVRKTEIDSLIARYNCLTCGSFHMLETSRVTPWIEALLQANRSVKELHFSLSAFCTLECRAFLSALSRNSTLEMATILSPEDQIPSELCKSIKMTGVRDRVTAELVCDVAYPRRRALSRKDRLRIVHFEELSRVLSDAAECNLITHMRLKVYSFLCPSDENDPTASPLVHLIRKATALANVAITVDRYCCSECWNKITPPLCDAIFDNKGIQALDINLPKKSDMRLLPLAVLLQRNPTLYRFTLKPSGPKAFSDFLRKVSKPKLWDNCNLAFVDLKDSRKDLGKEKHLMQKVADRNFNLAVRAARFVCGIRKNDDAEALKKVTSSLFLVKKVVVVVVTLLRPKKMGTSLKTGCAVLEEVGGDSSGYRSLQHAVDEPALVCRLGGTQEAYIIRARMPKRKREEDAPTTNAAKCGTSALLDMKGVRSRHTGLSVDYEKPCSRSHYRLCHVYSNTSAWNGFFMNVGLQLQENSVGDMTIVPQRQSKNTPYKSTQEEKAQAATLLYWLLTKHTCVKAVVINEDVFQGHEEIVCSALTGSAGISVLSLWLSSSTALLEGGVMSSLHSMKQLSTVRVSVNASVELFAGLAILLRTSSPLEVLRTVHVNANGCPALHYNLEACIKTRPLQGLCRSTDPQLVLGSSNLMLNQSLTALCVTATKHGAEVDVRFICEIVRRSTTITHFTLVLLKLEEKHAAPIKEMLVHTTKLKRFSLTYSDIEEPYTYAIAPRYMDSLTSEQYCLDCRSVHMLETFRVKPWIEALLHGSRSVNELCFSLSAFCAVECRAFLNALSKNSTLNVVTIPNLGQIPSEFCKSLTMSGVLHKVATDIICRVVYPGILPAEHRKPGHPVNVPFTELERTLSGAAACGLVTRVRFNVRSFLCLPGVTDPAASPFVQLIRKAPALVAVNIRVENGCCSRCWNETAPVLCDAVLHNTSIGTLGIKLPRNPTMNLLPLVNLLHRSRGLYKFTLEPPCPKVFAEFLHEVSKPKLWDNYSLGEVDLRCYGPDLTEELLVVQKVADRNNSLAMRAVSFLTGRLSKANAAALEKMAGYPFLAKKVCDSLSVNKQQALDTIARCLRTMADMELFMRLSGVVNRKIVCGKSSDGSTQLTALNEYCLRHIRQYLSISDIADSPL